MYNIVEDILLSYIALKKKKFEKGPFLDQNHGLTPLGKSQYFDFLKFSFLWPKKAFFVLEYSKRHFPGLCYIKNKSWKKGSF